MTAIASLSHSAILPRSRSPFLKKFLANKGAVLGAAVLLLFVLAAVLAPWIAPHIRSKPTSSRYARPPATGRAGNAVHRLGDSGRSQPVVPRPGPATAVAVLGLDAQYCEEFHGAGSVDVDCAWRGDLHHGPVFQPAG
ncbi:ABC-type dipeptide/oligopeptide/nickel transport systems, permease component [Pseudomonas syringae pv. syringae HS191]|nr:ABC-type dipeptide/oligopeptide/nickel transport systems, permease component [Pseudomonas syringae pv. syringae HS191]